MAIEIIEKTTIFEGKCRHCNTSIRCLPADTKLDYSHINYQSCNYPAPPITYVDCPKCASKLIVTNKEIDKIQEQKQ